MSSHSPFASFKAWLARLFSPDSKQTTPAPAHDKPAKATKKQTTEPEPSPSPDTPPWWQVPPQPIREHPEFDPIDDTEIISQLTFRVARKEFSIIEIPANITRAIQLLEREDSSYNEIASLIEQSPAVMGEFIRAANSAQLFRGRKVSNINVILSRLGRRNIRSMLYLCMSRLGLPSHPFLSAIAEKIIEHSLVTGRISEYFAKRYYDDSSKAFLAGLLHDIGKLAILREIGDHMNLPPEAADYTPDERMFVNIFPQLHEAAGSIVAQYWHLPDEIERAIANHHLDDFTVKNIPPESLDLIALIQLSDYAARILGFGTPLHGIDLLLSPPAIQLGIDPQDPETILFFSRLMELFEEA